MAERSRGSLRVGIVGAGIMGADHAANVHERISGAEIALVADVDGQRARALADRIGAPPWTTDARNLITDDRVDAVIVASHDSSHSELVRRCLDARKPVLCEKPLAPTAGECREIVRLESEAIRQTGRRLISLGFMRRFDPGYVEMKARLARNEVGSVMMTHSVSRGVASAPGATSELSITGSAIHEFDVIPWLTGSRIAEISWYAPQLGPSGRMRDPQLMVMATEDGAVHTVETFLNASYGYDIQCEVVGDAGTTVLGSGHRTSASVAGRHASDFGMDWRPRFADAYRIEVQSWVTSVRTGSEPELADARDGLRATLVSEAAIESMRTGATTRVSDETASVSP
jgi:myo-inositol 2-dehydrogenase/D-chiro-inositol 1-dehydrogenase